MNKILLIIMAILLAGALFFLVRFVMMGRQSGSMTFQSSVIDGHLKVCGKKPNCVCTQNDDSDHKVDLFPIKDNWENSKNLLLRVCEQLGGKPVEVASDYLHFEYRSKIFRFVDDVEFYLPAGASAIEVRSSSRVGYSDMGVNRKRVEKIRDAYENE